MGKGGEFATPLSPPHPRKNRQASLCKFKAYHVMVWFTHIVKLSPHIPFYEAEIWCLKTRFAYVKHFLSYLCCFYIFSSPRGKRASQDISNRGGGGGHSVYGVPPSRTGATISSHRPWDGHATAENLGTHRKKQVSLRTLQNFLTLL